MKSNGELADRIERGIEDNHGRYDFASKVEVKAYVDRKDAEVIVATLEGMNTMQAAFQVEVSALHTRLARLETPWWRKLLAILASRDK